MDNTDSVKKEEGRGKEKKTEIRDAEDPLTVEEEASSRTETGDTVEKDTGIDSLKAEEIEALITENEELQEKNRELEQKCALLAEYEDRILRKQAEFENYKKRITREFEENKKYANTGLILDVLNTIDNFERAIDSAKSSKDFDALLDGIVFVENGMKSMLEKKYGVIGIDDVGTAFDPNVHDAIMMEESDQYEDDTVIESLQRGYCMHGRVLRPAKVKVAKAVSSPGEPDEEEDGGDESSTKGV
ncbi:MAG: nucleotide exchange factor GrpE [Spirochaetes bacterium]|nr:nucleotide exchange factor GrpE [Spirochaetota bacterium]